MLSKLILLISFFILAIFLGFAIWVGSRNVSPSPELSSDSQNEENSESNRTLNINPKPILDKKGVPDAQLQIKANSFLPLFDNMQFVPIYVIDEPIISNGSETQKGVAYTVCLTNDNPTIYLKRVFYGGANQKQLGNIIKHELVHAWFCRQGVQVGHDERFRKKFKEVGGFGN